MNANSNAAGGGAALPPIYTDLERAGSTLERDPAAGLIKVPEGFFAADHPNTKLVVNLLNQGDLTRLKGLMDRGIGSHGIFQIADRGYHGSNKSMFHRQAILYLSLIGLAVYFNSGPIVTVIIREGGTSLLQSQFASGVQNSNDILTFPTEYIAVLMEAFNSLVPMLKYKFWNPYETKSLIYRRCYLQNRTPVLGYPDLLRCALVRSANYNLTGFFVAVKRETGSLSLSRLIYLGSIMVQHFDIDISTGKGTRRLYEAANNPRYVMPNLCSVSRRLLTLVAYQDPSGRLLSQVLGGLRECAQGGAYLSALPPEEVNDSLLFWLHRLVTYECKTSGLFRTLGPATEKLLLQEAYANLLEHYQRYDALNCISLLLGLLTHHNPAVIPDPLGYSRRLLDVTCAVAIQSGLADPLVTFAWPDQLLALRSLVNPVEPCVNFDQFYRLLSHIPIYAKSLIGSDSRGGTNRWQVFDRRSVLRLDWGNACRELYGLMSGEPTAVLADTSVPVVKVLVSQEQVVDTLSELKDGSQGNKQGFDYGAFYRLFEQRYRLWACCSNLSENLRPRAVVFSEDKTFSAALMEGNAGGG